MDIEENPRVPGIQGDYCQKEGMANINNGPLNHPPYFMEGEREMHFIPFYH